MFSLNRKLTLALCSLLFLTSSAWAQDISVQLDGRLLQFDQPPARMGGRLLVPLRGIFEALNADVVYDGATRSIQATKGSRVVQLQLGSRTAIIDGRTLFLDVPADTIGGRTMVPLRFVAEALGADVKWEGATKTVKLISAGGDQGGPSAPETPVTPPPTTAGNGPKIDRVFHNATTVLQPGSSLDIVLYGEPGGKATFELLGATKQISLPEVSSGKYQYRWIIPNGLTIEKGVLLAHLMKNGRETAEEAKREVTIRSQGSNNNNGGNNQNQSAWAEFPQSGGVTPSYRPAVTLTFPQDVQSNTVRFFVDGVDFTNQVRLSGRKLSWTPTYNLSAANHQAEVSAVGSQGQRLTHNWSFRIDPNAPNNNQGTNFQVSEIRPKEGSSVVPRTQIGAIFNKTLRSITMYLDGQLISSQQGVNRLSNGMFWNPNYNLSPGQHRVSVKAVDQNGQVLNKNWNFVVGNANITNFSVSPTRAAAGQNVLVQLQGPQGATGTFAVGQVNNLSLREVSAGRYQGTYTVRQQDQGTVVVSATLRQTNGRILNANAPNRLTFASNNQLTVGNLTNGMSIPPVFNVQGKGQPGRNVSVLVEYSSSNIIGAIAGQMKSFRTQGTVTSGGFYDVPVDASVIRAGQSFRITVSDGQSKSVQITMRRQ